MPADWDASLEGREELSAEAPRATITSLNRGQTSALHRRLDRWEPTYLPIAFGYLGIVVTDRFFVDPVAGVLGWPLTILWSWQILNTLSGMFGIRRTRKALRESAARWSGRGMPRCRDFLIVVIPTIGRHDVYPALERSVLSYVAHLSEPFPYLRIDIVVEEGCEARRQISMLAAQSPQIRLVTVPKRYRTVNGTKFKARAAHYSHELRIREHEDRDDVWVLHMDDDTGVGPDTAVAMARFIEEQRQADGDAKHLAQGILTYPREYAVNRFTWLADSVRPAEDVGRFSAWTGSGTPRAGVHGELLLVRASIEAAIGWDFGPGSLVEDAQFALIFSARYKGRSGWFGGRSYGASPASLRDFFQQRQRWSWGLAGLVCNSSLQLRNRLLLGYSVMAWVVGPIQNVGVVMLLGVLLSDPNTSPVTVFVIPLWALNMAYTIWMYWEGLRVNACVSGDGRRRWWEPIAVIVLIPVFGLMESVPGLCGFVKFLRGVENRFMVIAKPS
ncbi:Glycosyltransferase, catalytic subunit of cellulose synthase and poly-beta-1,6-N-acetylglucosamine synthase [Actinopolymorpha singaporensis]|uniref:Glycosyltransferase, catalytic subunit of cellulose synthase and poly-beta-1,6-N-acetylglucosamine synthase n=1 Tax=Actinopolymorpha singaporensis TaxID=117157 RepID=A0A1H1UJU0_9ACTN|nr:Glycosyltransferase, catalytic subunit of cellulose synthase and poly-beta-1,6-N-acetylglucosamine synthase [Actinopolymorpha singaporensis]